MVIKAHHRNARMAPRKIRVYREMLKGLPVKAAEAQLRFLPGHASALVRQVLQSAMANASHNYDIAADNLRVVDIVIDGGFVMKRFQPASKGMAHPILKRTSHITVVVEEVVAEGAKVQQRKGRQSDIQDFTTEDVVAGKVGGHVHEEVEEKTNTKKPQANEPHHSKQEEAYTKMKMQQGGGDAKKSHRRKSIGE